MSELASSSLYSTAFECLRLIVGLKTVLHCICRLSVVDLCSHFSDWTITKRLHSPRNVTRPCSVISIIDSDEDYSSVFMASDTSDNESFGSTSVTDFEPETIDDDAESERDTGFEAILAEEDYADIDSSPDDEAFEEYDTENIFTSSDTCASEFDSSSSFVNPKLKAACTEPLYSGSEMTIFMSYFLLFQYAVRHSLSNKAFGELIKLVSAFLPREAKLPSSVHKLKLFFTDIFPDVQAVKHIYCSSCHQLLSHSENCTERECTGLPSKEFVTIPLQSQLKRKLEGMFYTIDTMHHDSVFHSLGKLSCK